MAYIRDCIIFERHQGCTIFRSKLTDKLEVTIITIEIIVDQSNMADGWSVALSSSSYLREMETVTECSQIHVWLE